MNAERQARCYREKHGNHWQAVCIDYCLGSQADTSEEVEQKLKVIVDEYLHDALRGKDRGHAHYFLSREAPFKFRIKYYLYKLLSPSHII